MEENCLDFHFRSSNSRFDNNGINNIYSSKNIGNPPALAQADNMTGDGNMTEGNMTAPGIAGSGQATPVMPPP